MAGAKQSGSDDNASFEVKVKNVGDISGPYSISGMQGDSIVSTQWFSGHDGKQKVSFSANGVDRLKIDAQQDIPEINRKNNTWRTRGLFKGLEKPRLQFLASSENPNRTQIFYTPIYAWNSSDRNMLGLAVYNKTIPQKSLEYAFAPLYSFVGERVTGVGSVHYNFPGNNNSRGSRLGINAQSFSFATDGPLGDNHYVRLTPQLEIFPRVSPRSPVRQSIRLKWMYTYSEFLIPFIDEATGNFARANAENNYFDITYSYENRRTISPYHFQIGAQGHEDFVKGWLDAGYRYTYRPKKQIALRFFFGGFADNESNDPSLNFRMDGITGRNDYAYEQLLFDRFRFDPVFGQQFVMGQGGFKIPTALGQSNKWITSLNLKYDFPGPFPIGLYGDLGMWADGDLVITNGIPVLYDAGAYISVVRDVFEVYFPFVYSAAINDEIEANGLHYEDLIRFQLNLGKLNPLKLADNPEGLIGG